MASFGDPCDDFVAARRSSTTCAGCGFEFEEHPQAQTSIFDALFDSVEV